MSKHTHTPWRIKHQYNITDDNNRSVSTCGGFSDMTEESHNENLANAAYIVHCVNNHEALVDALRKAINHLDVDNLTMQTIEKELNEVLQEAQL